MSLAHTKTLKCCGTCMTDCGSASDLEASATEVSSFPSCALLDSRRRDSRVDAYSSRAKGAGRIYPRRLGRLRGGSLLRSIVYVCRVSASGTIGVYWRRVDVLRVRRRRRPQGRSRRRAAGASCVSTYARGLSCDEVDLPVRGRIFGDLWARRGSRRVAEKRDGGTGGIWRGHCQGHGVCDQRKILAHMCDERKRRGA